MGISLYGEKLDVPKHRFMSWLVVQHMLKIKDRMLICGIINNSLCGMSSKTHEHLFLTVTIAVNVVRDCISDLVLELQ